MDIEDATPRQRALEAAAATLLTVLALLIATGTVHAGDYGEYPGQGDRHWASRAFDETGVRVRGRHQYQPGGYSDSGYYRDRYSPGHRIRAERHSHPHHRERGYSRVTHIHPVTHTHYYRPRYTHPRYTHHYRRWRPHYHYTHRPWQERAWQRYITVSVPVDRYGNILPGYGYRPDDYRDPRDRAYFERIRHEELSRRSYGYRDDPRDRYEGRRDCKPVLKHFGETRMRQDSAKAQAQLGWSAAVGLEHGLKYANIKHARRKHIECHIAGYKEEGVEKAMDNFAKLWNRQDNWKSKCVVEAIPCAPKRGDSDDSDGDEPDSDEVEVIERPGPTR